MLARGPDYPHPGLARFYVAEEGRLTAPRYQFGPPTPGRPWHGSVPPPSRGGTVLAAASTEATLKRETSA
jgi:hypothetical protein